jgi:hypothetical protein
VQGSIAGLTVPRVDLSSAIEQQPGNARVARERGIVKRSRAGRIDCVDFRTAI